MKHQRTIDTEKLLKQLTKAHIEKARQAAEEGSLAIESAEIRAAEKTNDDLKTEQALTQALDLLETEAISKMVAMLADKRVKETEADKKQDEAEAAKARQAAAKAKSERLNLYKDLIN